MGRGRSAAGRDARKDPRPPRPARLEAPPDRDRVNVVGEWTDYLRTDPPSLAIIAELNARYRLPETVRVGAYSNGREQGLRFTRPAEGDDPGLTIWVSEYRTSDHIVIYRLEAESDERNWSDLDGEIAEAMYSAKEMNGHDQAPQVAERIAEWFGAVPISAFAAPPPRSRTLADALSRPRSEGAPLA